MHQTYRGAGITAPIKEEMDTYKTLGIEIDADLCRPEYRLTIDEAIDIEMISNIYDALYKNKPIDLHDVYTWLDDNPDIAKMNMHVAIKGCEQQSANLTEKPIFSIVPSGPKFVILDSHKRKVEPQDFIKVFNELFPKVQRERR